MYQWTAAERQKLLQFWAEGKTIAEFYHYFEGQSIEAVATAVKRFAGEQDRLAREHSLARQTPELAHRITVLMEADTSLTDILAWLSLSRPAYTQIVKNVDIKTIQRWRSRRRTSPRGYTAEQCIAALRAANRLTGAPLTVAIYKQLQRANPEWPSISTLYRYRGWDDWMKRARIRPRLNQGRVRPPLFSDEVCRQAAIRVGEEYGRAYTEIEYNARRRPDEPIGKVIRHRFGDGIWHAALQHLAPKLAV